MQPALYDAINNQQVATFYIGGLLGPVPASELPGYRGTVARYGGSGI